MATEACYEGDTKAIELIEGKTIGQLFDLTCRNQGLREALVFSDEQVQLTFTQLAAKVNKLAAGLLFLGLKPGDKVVLWGANHSNNVLSVYACAKAGLGFSTLSHMCTASNLQHHLNAVNAKAIICFPTIKPGHCYDMLRTLESKIVGSKGRLDSKIFPNLKYIIVDEEDAKQGAMLLLSEILDLANKDKSACDKLLEDVSSVITADSCAAVQAKTGTSDNPKLCYLSHYQLINSCLVGAKRLNLQNMSEVLCCPLPIFRGPILCLAVMATAVVGAKVVYPSALPMPPAIFESIQCQKCTCLLSNPMALHLMLRMPVAKKFTLDSITCVCLGGDHTTAEQKSVFTEKLPNITDIASGVFLTEAGFMPFVYPSKSKFEDIGKWDGKIADHYKVKVIDFYGKPTTFDKPGQICISLIGGSKFLGYVEAEKSSTGKKQEENWFLTDDVATLSKNGFVTLLGRVNEVIFKNSAAVIPFFLEKLMATHPAILGCQVVGLPDNKLGEKICACLVKKDKGASNEDLLKKELLDMCNKEKLEIPDCMLFVDDFPRNQAKKVEKSKLKVMITEKLC